MDKVLIDSDVILDVFLDRPPFAPFASEIFRRCENNEIRGYTTPVIICNLYYILSRISSHGKIIEKLKQLLMIVDIAVTDKAAVIEALNSDFKDFEDALQNFTATQNGKIQIILTRNIKDYQKSTLAVFSPEMYLKNQNGTR